MIEKKFQPDKLKQLRQRHQLTAKQLAEKISELRRHQLTEEQPAEKIDGVTKHTIYAWESGARNPRSQSIADLSTILNVPTDYFFQVDQKFEYAGSIRDMEHFLKQPGFALTEEERSSLIEHFSQLLERKIPHYHEDRP